MTRKSKEESPWPSSLDETVYYSGHASGVRPIIASLKWLGIATGLTYVLNLSGLEGFRAGLGDYQFILWLLVVAIPVLKVGLSWWDWNAVRYTLTNKKITFQRGIFSRTIKSIELWRVKEVIFNRTALEAIVGVGNLLLVSKDLTGPFTRVGPIRNAKRVYEMINSARDKAIEERGVMAVES